MIATQHKPEYVIIPLCETSMLVDSLESLVAERHRIRKISAETFPRYFETLHDAVGLLIDATAVLQGSEPAVDHHSADGASKMAVWRFLSALPASASWCIDAAASGDYFIAKTLLRLVLEESVKLAYYAEHPDDALRQVKRSSDKDDIKLPHMVREVAAERGQGLMRLWGYLSAYYSHANMNLPAEFLFADQSGQPQIGGGPRFEPELFVQLAQQLLILLANGIYAAARRFPALSGHSGWSSRLPVFARAAAELMPSNDTYGVSNEDIPA